MFAINKNPDRICSYKVIDGDWKQDIFLKFWNYFFLIIYCMDMDI